MPEFVTVWNVGAVEIPDRHIGVPEYSKRRRTIAESRSLQIPTEIPVSRFIMRTRAAFGSRRVSAASG
jgi:hypothetical protein